MPLDEGMTVVTASAKGQVKRSAMDEYTSSRQPEIEAAGLKDDDRIVAVDLCTDEDDIVLAHSGGYVTRFAAEEVRTMGRTATGVIGMDVPDDEEVVSLTVVPAGVEDAGIVTVGADGMAKRSPLSDYPVKGRGGKGLVTGVDELRWCGVAADLHLAADEPAVLRPVDLPEAKRSARGTALDVELTGPVVPERVAASQRQQE